MRALGRYQLVRALGAGERVWEATLLGPAGFRKTVALRLLDAAGAEAFAASRSGGARPGAHEVEVYEVDCVDGQWICAMELIRSGPLAALAPLPPRAVVEVGVQLCAALADRPGAVLVALEDVLNDEGRVKLAPIWRAAEGTEGGVAAIGTVLAQLSIGPDSGAGPVVGALLELLEEARRPGGRFASLEALAEGLRAVDPAGPGLADLVEGGATPIAATARSGVRSNLDRIPRLIGRAPAVAEVVARLSTARLVTVKGPPGVGKSQLARHVGRLRLDAGAVEAWWVDADGVAVEQAVAEVLQLSVDPSVPVAEQIALRGEVLLVVDQPRPQDAPVLEHWLRTCPGLKILATSTRVLGISGEQRVELGALAPEDARTLLGSSDPVRLGLAEGLPGALVCLRGLEPGEDAHLRLGNAALAARIAEVVSGLDDWGRRALATLCAVEGSFELEDAEVALDQPGAPWALDRVTELSERSLLTTLGDGRLKVPEPIRTWVAGSGE